VFDYDLLTWSLLLGATFLGAAFQGVVGFGLAFTIVPLLAIVEPLAVPTIPLPSPSRCSSEWCSPT
jgi:uncharacterized membrane protein YfcA